MASSLPILSSTSDEKQREGGDDGEQWENGEKKREEDSGRQRELRPH